MKDRDDKAAIALNKSAEAWTRHSEELMKLIKGVAMIASTNRSLDLQHNLRKRIESVSRTAEETSVALAEVSRLLTLRLEDRDAQEEGRPRVDLSDQDVVFDVLSFKQEAMTNRWIKPWRAVAYQAALEIWASYFDTKGEAKAALRDKSHLVAMGYKLNETETAVEYDPARKMLWLCGELEKLRAAS